MYRLAAITVLLTGLTGTAAGAPVHQYPKLVQHSAQTSVPAPLVASDLMEKWTKVAQCETHQNWQREGTWHDGGLGILLVAWRQYGGLEFAPAPHLATPEEQVAIAIRINQGFEIPDQNGECQAW